MQPHCMAVIELIEHRRWLGCFVELAPSAVRHQIFTVQRLSMLQFDIRRSPIDLWRALSSAWRRSAAFFVRAAAVPAAVR